MKKIKCCEYGPWSFRTLTMMQTCKTFISVDAKFCLSPGANIINLFCPWFADFHTQLECLLDQAEKACHGQNTRAYYENSLITDKKVS